MEAQKLTFLQHKTGLGIVSNTGKICNIIANSSTFSGIAKVIATYYNSNIGVYETKSFPILIGKPTPAGLTLSNTSNGSSSLNGGTISIYNTQTNNLQLSHSQYLLTGANWVFPNGWSVGTNGNSYNTVYFSTGMGAISIFPTNSCGTSQYPATYYVSGIAQINSNEITLFPNIATNSISVKFENIDKNKLPQLLTMVDPTSSIVSKKYTFSKLDWEEIFINNNTLNLDISNIKAGTYILNFSNFSNNINFTKRLVIR